MKYRIFSPFTRKEQNTGVPSRDASSMSAQNCEDTFNQDNSRQEEEEERRLFNTSLFLVMGCCCFIPICLGFATLLTLLKNTAFVAISLAIYKENHMRVIGCI
jgi:hypothetical protein